MQVKVSAKYQIVIPVEVRAALKIRPGLIVEVMALEGRIEVVPVRPIQKMKGYLRGISTTVLPEPRRS